TSPREPNGNNNGDKHDNSGIHVSSPPETLHRSTSSEEAGVPEPARLL
ncbi:unnamed protein product, partial [Rotaria sp. Silwood1]